MIITFFSCNYLNEMEDLYRENSFERIAGRLNRCYSESTEANLAIKLAEEKNEN